MRYLLTITYDGENYAGWQKQVNEKTIQGELENALKILLKEDVNLQKKRVRKYEEKM